MPKDEKKPSTDPNLSPDTPSPDKAAEARIVRLEKQVDALIAAVEVLTRKHGNAPSDARVHIQPHITV